MQSFGDVEKCVSYMHNVASSVLLPQVSSRIIQLLQKEKKLVMVMDIRRHILQLMSSHICCCFSSGRRRNTTLPSLFITYGFSLLVSSGMLP